MTSHGGTYDPVNTNTHAKPVFVCSGLLMVKNNNVSVNFSASLLKMVNPVKTQVICPTPDYKNKPMDKLKSLQMYFLKISEPQQKPRERIGRVKYPRHQSHILVRSSRPSYLHCAFQKRKNKSQCSQ